MRKFLISPTCLPVVLPVFLSSAMTSSTAFWYLVLSMEETVFFRSLNFFSISLTASSACLPSCLAVLSIWFRTFFLSTLRMAALVFLTADLTSLVVSPSLLVPNRKAAIAPRIEPNNSARPDFPALFIFILGNFYISWLYSSKYNIVGKGGWL